MADITQDEAREYFTYDPDTGVLRWIKKPCIGVSIGDAAGCSHSSGYVAVKLRGRQILAHRLIWALVYGARPILDIDHINGVRNDNRLVNLRLATRALNAQNIRSRKPGRSGVTGVQWHKQRGKWVASIQANGRAIHLGVFSEKRAAVEARSAAEKSHHPYRPMEGV